MVARGLADCLTTHDSGRDTAALGRAKRRAILAAVRFRAILVVPSILVVATLWLSPAPAAAQAPPPGPGWVTDTRTGCRVWNTNPKTNLSASWSGPCQNRVAQGHGVLQWSANDRPGDRYEGDLVGGKYDGHGVYISADGFRYDGEWRDGRANGSGELTTKTASYNGRWVDGCFRDGDRRAWVGVAASTCR